jgi:hypothetical protein
MTTWYGIRPIFCSIPITISKMVSTYVMEEMACPCSILALVVGMARACTYWNPTLSNPIVFSSVSLITLEPTTNVVTI